MHLRCVMCTVLAMAMLLGSSPAAEPPGDKLADLLGRLDGTVVPAEEQKASANMVRDAIRTERKVRDDQSTAVWQAVSNRADWEKFLKPKLEALEASLGRFPEPAKKMNVRVTGTTNGDGFRIDNLVFESRPGLWVTANLYRPEKPGDSMPGIIICHAHHTPKEHGELQDMGMTWARAGCLVLVMDQLGHGERRQHPFVDAGSYSKPYRVSRQDYYFRYDTGIQLHLIGDSLIGWMVWDLRRGVDLLLAQKGVDPKRILLLGSVAGGGDPAAVAAALDQRITAVVPFNFGGPSPQPHYPFAADKEPEWNYAGGGSWESTRNLRLSAADGFLPWVIVAAAAPRRLVYAHEFAWFREGDPVWKRLQAVYGFHEAGDRLAFTFGKGDVTGKPPEATHCTHIGPVQRKLLHEAFRRWFDIEATEYSKRLPPEKLRCLTPEVVRELKPARLTDIVGELAAERMEQARKRRQGMTAAEQRQQLQKEWSNVLGFSRPMTVTDTRGTVTEKVGQVTLKRVVLPVTPGLRVPLLLLIPPRAADRKPAVVVAVAQAGKAALLHKRAAEIAALLEGGVAVCLPDVRGTGESSPGGGRGRNSPATALSSSQLMLGRTMVKDQLSDLNAVLAWLKKRSDLDGARLAVWGDSLAAVNPANTSDVVPRDDDAALPAQSEPLGGLLALLAGLYEDDVKAICVRGGLASFRSVLDSHLVLIPHDVVLPGVLTTGDLDDVAAALAPRPLRLQGLVNGRNRAMQEKDVREAFRRASAACRERGAPSALSLTDNATPLARWLLEQLR